MWRKWYNWVEFAVFKEQRLWRFPALAAKPLVYLKELLVEKYRSAPGVAAVSVSTLYRRVWTEPLPRAPVLRNPWLVGEIAIRASKRGLPVALPRDEEVDEE
jgi:hypothetical protein